MVHLSTLIPVNELSTIEQLHSDALAALEESGFAVHPCVAGPVQSDDNRMGGLDNSPQMAARPCPNSPKVKPIGILYPSDHIPERFLAVIATDPFMRTNPRWKDHPQFGQYDNRPVFSGWTNRGVPIYRIKTNTGPIYRPLKPGERGRMP